MDNLYGFIGLLGSLCFAISSWPQAYYTIKTHDTSGVSWGFISLMVTGGLSSSIYAILTTQYMLLPNFVCGATGILIVGIYKTINMIKGRTT